MSDLSVFLRKVSAFFQTVPVASTPGLGDAAQKLTDAADAVEGVLPGLAKAGADAALAAAGPVGVTATPFVNGFIDLLIAELTARKTTAPAPVPVPQAPRPLPLGASGS